MAAEPRVCTIDFETYYDKEYTLKSMSTEEYIRDPRFEIICVAVRDPFGTFRVIDGAKGLIHVADELRKLDVERYPMLCQNTNFDAAIARWKLGITSPMYLDTRGMASATIRHLTGSTSLKSIAEHLHLPPKGTAVHNMIGIRRRDMTPEQYAAYADYCKHDVLITFLAFTMLRPQISSVHMLAIDRLVRMYVEPRLEIDLEKCEEALGDATMAVNSLLTEAGMTMEEAASDAKFADKLGAVIGREKLPVKVSPTTGKATFAFAKSDVEFRALEIHPNYKVRTMVKARLAAKSTIERTRLAAFAETAKRNYGKLPVPLKFWGAISGRPAGTDGLNLLNLTRGSVLREVVVAPKDHVVLAADKSQIEARLNATWSGQWDLVEDFEQGVDIYSDFATSVFGYPVNKKDHPKERFVGKTCVLGLGYYMGPGRLMETLKLSNPIEAQFAEKCVQTYRDKYHMIKKNWYRAADMIKHMIAGARVEWGPMVIGHECMTLPSGMKMFYPELRYDPANEEYWYRDRMRSSRVGAKGDWTKLYSGKLVENGCQALGAELIWAALVKLSMKWCVVLQVYDEIVFVIHKHAIDDAIEDITRVMTKRPDWMPRLPLAIEINYGDTYADCK